MGHEDSKILKSNTEESFLEKNYEEKLKKLAKKRIEKVKITPQRKENKSVKLNLKPKTPKKLVPKKMKSNKTQKKVPSKIKKNQKKGKKVIHQKKGNKKIHQKKGNKKIHQKKTLKKASGK